ncbi:hypothetical protein R1flu_027124 [Riccia fluitans]|uniref:Uncharacterized protein n=1 Tax=Riccia fluitans TaxID=41844 RepID=A0ABD1XKV2_9MARC
MPMSKRKRFRAVIKGKIRDTFFRHTYTKLGDESTHCNGASADFDLQRSRNSSSKDLSRSRSSSGHGPKVFSRNASSSGSSRYSRSGSSRRSVIALDPKLLKQNDSSVVYRPLDFSRSSSRSDFSRSTRRSASSKYSISSCSSKDLTQSKSRSSSDSAKHIFSVVGLKNRLLRRSDPINRKRNVRFLNRTDSLVPKKFHLQFGVSAATSPALTRENSFGGLNWSKPPPNMTLKHVDSLVIISAKIQPPVRIRDCETAYAEIAKHRSFKRINTLRSFKRVDPVRALKRLESVRAMQPAAQPLQRRRLKRSKNITRRSRLWKTSCGMVHFQVGFGRFVQRRPRNCYIRAMLKAAEERLVSSRDAAAAFDETPTVFKFGPIHVDEIEEEVGFCRDVMLFYHRSVSSVC